MFKRLASARPIVPTTGSRGERRWTVPDPVVSPSPRASLPRRALAELVDLRGLFSKSTLFETVAESFGSGC